MKRKLRMGMVGGGPGAFIGHVHRRAARMDGEIELVAGAFDINPRKSRQMGRRLYLDPSRVYDDYGTMIKAELALSEKERIDFVSIVTPNNWHYPIARDFLKNGFHVMCEKPLALSLREAKALRRVRTKSGMVFGLMHNYVGYPMVKLARDLVRAGDAGKIMKVVVQYPQGWLIRPIEKKGNQQASWRMDPKQSGMGGCLGDIGTHAHHLAEFITGMRVTEVCAELSSFVPGRPLDDDATVLMRFAGGARGLLFASQISAGEENNFAIHVYGDKKSLHWRQEDPTYLTVKSIDRPVETWRYGNPYVARKSPAAARATRLPAGHPEAFFEAFANHYRDFAELVRARIQGRKPDPLANLLPDIEDGLRGMAFIETVVQAADSRTKWIRMKKA